MNDYKFPFSSVPIPDSSVESRPKIPETTIAAFERMFLPLLSRNDPVASEPTESPVVKDRENQPRSEIAPQRLTSSQFPPDRLASSLPAALDDPRFASGQPLRRPPENPPPDPASGIEAQTQAVNSTTAEPLSTTMLFVSTKSRGEEVPTGGPVAIPSNHPCRPPEGSTGLVEEVSKAAWTEFDELFGPPGPLNAQTFTEALRLPIALDPNRKLWASIEGNPCFPVASNSSQASLFAVPENRQQLATYASTISLANAYKPPLEEPPNGAGLGLVSSTAWSLRLPKIWPLIVLVGLLAFACGVAVTDVLLGKLADNRIAPAVRSAQRAQGATTTSPWLEPGTVPIPAAAPVLPVPSGVSANTSPPPAKTHGRPRHLRSQLAEGNVFSTGEMASPPAPEVHIPVLNIPAAEIPPPPNLIMPAGAFLPGGAAVMPPPPPWNPHHRRKHKKERASIWFH